MQIGDRHVALEDVDLRRRRVIFRERPASDYAMIDWRIGAQIPDFPSVDVAGVRRSLDEFTGKYLLLHFWGTVFERGAAPLDDLKSAREMFGIRGLKTVGFDWAPMIEEEAVNGRAFVKDDGIDWVQATPQAVGRSGRTGFASERGRLCSWTRIDG